MNAWIPLSLSAVKRYNFALFVGEVDGAQGGWDDCFSRWATLEEALEASRQYDRPLTWWHIVDLDANEIVATFEEET